MDTGGAELGLEVGREPPTLEDTVVVATPGGEVERASRRLASKRKREDELTQQPARHSLWEQGSLEAHNEWLFGCLDGEVVALQQRKAEYDEERRLSEGSDSCWSGADSDTDSAAELEVDKEPLAVESAAVVAAQGGELEGVAQGSLQADGEAPARLGRSGQGEVSSLRPRGLAPERLRGKTIEHDSRGN